MASVITGSSVQANNIISNQVNVSPLKNWIINGGFDVWQRGTSFPITGDIYTADRWVEFRNGSGDTATISRQPFTTGQTEVPNNPTYFFRYNVSVAGTGNTYRVLDQRIEDVTKLAGKTVSLSFWAKADTNRTIYSSLVNFHGNGGSADVSTPSVQFNLTSSWSKFTSTFIVPSVNGKTITSSNFMYLRFSLPSGVIMTIDIANVSLVEGSVPVEWQTEAYADVLRQCQRYYLYISNEGYVYGTIGLMTADDASYGHIIINFPVDMRVQPTSIDLSPMSSYYWSGVGYGNTPTSMVIDSKNTRMCKVAVYKPSAFSSGASYLFRANNTASAWIGVNAEL